MSFSTTQNKAQHTANGVTTAFSFPYLFYDNSHLVVTTTDLSTGAETTKLITTDYTVTGAGAGAGGTVTFLVAPANGLRVTIRRVVPLTQLTDYVNDDDFPEETLERDIDKAIMAIQQTDENVDRCLQYPSNETTSAVATLPLAAQRANKMLGFDASGDPTLVANASDSAVAAAASAAAAATSETNAAASASSAASAVSAAVPLTTKGDILTRDGSANARLAIGSNGTVLMADSAQTTGLKYGLGLHSYRNKIINGAFGVAQRGTTHTNATDAAYTLDRWKALVEAANAVTITRETSTINNELYAMKLAATATNNNKFGVVQFIEGEWCKNLRGKTVTLSFYAKADASITDLRAGIVEWTGAVNSLTSDPISAWGGAGTNPTLVANYAFINTPAALAVSTSYQLFSVTATLGSTFNNLAVIIWSDDKTTTNGHAVYLSEVQLEEGSSYTKFESRQRSIEDILCRRYYFEHGMASVTLGLAKVQNSTLCKMWVAFPSFMRTSPSVSSRGSLADIKALDGSVTVDTTSISTADGATDHVVINITSTAGTLTTGRCATIECTSATAAILYDSEL